MNLLDAPVQSLDVDSDRTFIRLIRYLALVMLITAAIPLTVDPRVHVPAGAVPGALGVRRNSGHAGDPPAQLLLPAQVIGVCGIWVFCVPCSAVL